MQLQVFLFPFTPRMFVSIRVGFRSRQKIRDRQERETKIERKKGVGEDVRAFSVQNEREQRKGFLSTLVQRKRTAISKYPTSPHSSSGNVRGTGGNEQVSVTGFEKGWITGFEKGWRVIRTEREARE